MSALTITMQSYYTLPQWVFILFANVTFLVDLIWLWDSELLLIVISLRLG